MAKSSSGLSQDFFIRGRDYLARFKNFELVGREETLAKLTAVLMRQSANSVLLVASKQKEGTPFDIVSKRFFWVDSDLLFASGDSNKINAEFEKMLRTLTRTPNSVLIVEDMRDFIDAARNNGCTNLINALMHSVKRQNFQIILEARDEDLQTVLACHSDMKEGYTLLDIDEPNSDLLTDIVRTISNTRLRAHHRIKISDEAIETAIDVTSKYRVRDMGLSRAQPDRTITLLDRALTSYRLEAHARDPRVDDLNEKLLAEKDATKKTAIEKELETIETAWSKRQNEIKRLDTELRDGEEAIRELEIEIEEQQEAEAQLRESVEDTPKAEKKGFVSFAARVSSAGYESLVLFQVYL